MAKEEEQFIDAGLTHYPSALRAVRRFEETIRAELSRVLRRHAVTGSQVSYVSGKGRPMYLEAMQRLRLSSRVEATVTVGVSWEEEDSPYFYVCCTEGPTWATHPIGGRFTADGGSSYFCEPEGRSRGTVEKRIERLFGEWLEAMKKAGRGRKR